MSLVAPRARNVPEVNRPETIEETAELVQQAGGGHSLVGLENSDMFP